jgi:hypothetical protein
MSSPTKETSERDRLLARPDVPLPTALDPQVHENPKDPKPVPKTPQGTDPKAEAIDCTV